MRIRTEQCSTCIYRPDSPLAENLPVLEDEIRDPAGAVPLRGSSRVPLGKLAERGHDLRRLRGTVRRGLHSPSDRAAPGGPIEDRSRIAGQPLPELNSRYESRKTEARRMIRIGVEDVEPAATVPEKGSGTIIRTRSRSSQPLGPERPGEGARHHCWMASGGLRGSSLPEVLEAAAENSAAQGEDGVGAGDGPAHARRA